MSLTRTHVKLTFNLISIILLPIGGMQVYAQTANFAVSDTLGCVPLSVDFTNQSSGASSYLWDFDDGLTSIATNPTHIFYGQGTYNITLYAYDSLLNVDSMSIVIQVPANTPFFNVASEACPNQSLQFTVFGNYDPNNLITWDFGDGTTSSNSFTEHAYVNTGNYTVILTVISPVCGVVIDSTDIYITDTLSPSIHIHPEYGTTTICPGEAFPLFYDENYSINWDFGDGDSSTDPYPNHVYDSSGTYLVTITITNECGNTSTLDTNIIVDPGAFPIASAYASNFAICPNTDISMSAVPGSGYSYAWDFGDGENATGRATSHAYTSQGLFKVILTVTNMCGQISIDTVQVNIVDTLPVNGWLFLDKNETCLTDSISFVAPSNMSSYLWDLGDGNFDTTRSFRYGYSDTGTYVILLTLTNGCGNSTTYIDTVVSSSNLLTSAQFTTDQNTYCQGDLIEFNSVNSSIDNIYLWNFGDSNSASGSSANHSYSDTGTYLVTLYLTNTCGVTDSVSRYIIVDTSSSPVAAFTTSPYFYSCPNHDIQFINESSDSSGILWTFGDGNSSNLTNPTYTYTLPGNYFITLQVMNSCGLSSSTSQLILISSANQLGATSITCSEIGDSIVFSWDSISGAAGYEISQDSGATWTELASGVTTYSVLGVSVNTYSLLVGGLGPDYCKFGEISDTAMCIYIGTGVKEELNSYIIKVFPNPSSGQITIHIETGASSDMLVEIYDVVGREIKAIKGELRKAQVDLGQAESGTYLLKISLEGQKPVYRKVVLFR